MAYQTKTARKPKGRHHNSRRAAAIIISLLVIAGGVFAFLCIAKPFDKKTDNDTNVSQKSDDAGKSDGSVDPLGEKSKDKSEEREKEKENVSQYDDSSLDKIEGLSGIINFAGISEGKFLVNATIYQQFGADGSCEVSLVGPTGRMLGGSVQTEAGPASTFCSYSIPASGIESGKWQITVFVQHGKETGTFKTEVQI